MERITIRRTIVTILWKTNLLLLSSGSGNSFLHVPAVSTSPAPWLFLSKRERHDSDFLPQPMVAHHVIAWSILDCAWCMVFYSTQIKQQEFDRSCSERERAGKKGTQTFLFQRLQSITGSARTFLKSIINGGKISSFRVRKCFDLSISLIHLKGPHKA